MTERAELPADIAALIDELSEEGNVLLENGRPGEAVERWQEALRLLPAPLMDWEAATWLFASIGDAHYQQGNFEAAKDAFHDALNGPDGQENPFIVFRLGQVYLALNQEDRAVDFLLRAYMLDGQDIFEADPDGAAALQLLEARELIKIV